MSDEKPIYTAENPKPYDETEFYEAELEPLVEKIRNLCLEKDIPHLIVIQTQWNGKNNLISGSVFSGDETHSVNINRAWSIFE